MIITLAEDKDRESIARLDRHIPPQRLGECIGNGWVYVLKGNDPETGDGRNRTEASVIGVLRYSLFWQTVPFLDLLYIEEGHRNRGFGTQMMCKWENEMKKRGYPYVMTSTQADESAWKFYEKLGYRRIGGFFPPMQDAEEWMYTKALGASKL